MRLQVKPAYGRDYKSKKAVMEAWNGNKDFIILTVFSPDRGRYINKQDADDAIPSIEVRYSKLTRYVILDVGKHY